MGAVSRWYGLRTEMQESAALGSALLAEAMIGLFGWDIAIPETFGRVNTAHSTYFVASSHRFMLN
jgi:hypothetical protein